jgi:hypothetical protein
MSNKLLAALTIVAASVLALPLIGRTMSLNHSVPTAATSVKSPQVEAATNIPSEDEPQVISLEATPSGFEPAEIIAHRGKFLILLQNRSGQRDLNFSLARENQERLAQSDSQKRDWKAQVQLGPGTYVIGEISHPEWQAVIRVTN